LYFDIVDRNKIIEKIQQKKCCWLRHNDYAVSPIKMFSVDSIAYKNGSTSSLLAISTKKLADNCYYNVVLYSVHPIKPEETFPSFYFRYLQKAMQFKSIPKTIVSSAWSLKAS
jgi:hypothetical protein